MLDLLEIVVNSLTDHNLLYREREAHNGQCSLIYNPEIDQMVTVGIPLIIGLVIQSLTAMTKIK